HHHSHAEDAVTGTSADRRDEHDLHHGEDDRRRQRFVLEERDREDDSDGTIDGKGTEPADHHGNTCWSGVVQAQALSRVSIHRVRHTASLSAVCNIAETWQT